MTETELLSKEETGHRLTTGMGLVYDLFNELYAFNRIIRENVDGTVDARLLKNGKLSLAKKDKSAADRAVSCNLVLLFELDVQGPDDDPDVEEDPDIETREKSTGLEITPDSRFLAFRTQLYRLDCPSDFQPYIAGAVLADVSWLKKARGKKNAPKTLNKFKTSASKFLRIVRGLDDKTVEGSSIEGGTKNDRMFANVQSANWMPLTSFESEESIANFVASILSEDL